MQVDGGGVAVEAQVFLCRGVADWLLGGVTVTRGQNDRVNAVDDLLAATANPENPSQGSGRKGRSGSDCFGRKSPDSVRGFEPDGRYGSDAFRADGGRKPGREGRHKPRQPSRARGRNPRIPEDPPASFEGGPRRTRSSSRRRTSPTGAGGAAAESALTSGRSAAASGLRRPLTVPTGSVFARGWGKSSRRTRSGSGWIRSR